MEIAFGVGSLVLLAGGLTAAIKRTLRPQQAVAILAVAVVVAVVAALADRIASGTGGGGVYSGLVTAVMTLGGIVMAVAIVLQPGSTRRS